MKLQEGMEAQRRLSGDLPILIRIDGRRFSKFSRSFKKPFDAVLSNAMIDTCAYLLEETQARVGYVQSDEITLVLLRRSDEDQILFNGRVQKLASICAAMATAKFTQALLPTHADKIAEDLPVFDARVWQAPSIMEAVNAVLWRVLDASKNGISVTCRSVASPAEMQGLSGKEMIELMSARGIDFEKDIAVEDRLGVFLRKERAMAKLAEDVLARIPEAHRPADGVVERSVMTRLSGQDFLDAPSRLAFVFGDNIPITENPGPMKQVLVVRKDLKMRRGKENAQNGHAAQLSAVNNLYDPRVQEWMQQNYAKVSVSVDSEEELVEVMAAAGRAGLLVTPVIDHGLTEFGGEHTLTCAAIGPDTVDRINPVTGHLKLR
jgi:PTH2 family peptidyl-tRNA hydrolase